MKKIIFLFFFLVSLLAVAQDSSHGFRAGLGYSTLRLDQNADADPRYGMTVSFFGEYKLSEKLRIVPEIGYSYLGANNQAELLDQPNRLESLKSNWVHAISTLRFNLSQKLYAGVGGSLSLQIKTERDLYRHWDIAGIGLIGYQIDRNFFVDLRYNHGFINVLQDNINGVDKGYNTYIQLGVGYKI